MFFHILKDHQKKKESESQGIPLVEENSKGCKS